MRLRQAFNSDPALVWTDATLSCTSWVHPCPRCIIFSWPGFIFFGLGFGRLGGSGMWTTGCKSWALAGLFASFRRTQTMDRSCWRYFTHTTSSTGLIRPFFFYMRLEPKGGKYRATGARDVSGCGERVVRRAVVLPCGGGHPRRETIAVDRACNCFQLYRATIPLAILARN